MRDTLARLAGLEGVASAMAAARDGIDALLRDRGFRETAKELTAESLLRGASASGALEGDQTSLDLLRSGGGGQASRAAVRVSVELLGLTSTLAAAPLQVLARLHALAGKGVVADIDLGRPRTEEAARRLADLAGLLTAGTSAPALVAAAVTHAELVTVAPFVSHNGIVARAFERLMLVGRGVDPKSLVVPEAGHLALRAQYESNLVGYRDGGRPGVHSWLLYAAHAYAAGADASPLNRH